MGAHSTFEQALAGVTAFATAAPSDSESEDKQRSKNSKKGKAKKEKKVSKKASKHKVAGKKRSKKRRRSDSESEYDSSEPETLQMQLERGRAAARCTRQIMSYFPTSRQSLRQMFWRLDNKEAVKTSGIPDANLKGLLEVLFGYLHLLKASEGIYVKRKNGDSVLGQLGHILDESPAERPAQGPTEGAAKPAADDTAAIALEASADAKKTGAPSATQADHALPNGRTAASGSVAIGPMIPEEFWEHLEHNGQDAANIEGDAEGNGNVAVPVSAKRVIGPAMPPQELLKAAAEVADAMAAEEAALAAETLIGPPPPELTAEDEAVVGDTRTAEVVRILKVLEAAAREKKVADAYELVGVESDAKAADIKRRYWRLSLMIHPDKCEHPKAQDAFHAVSQAAKDLQDAGKRTVINSEREKAEYEAFAQEELKKEETARQWRVARGEGTAEDLQGPKAGGPAEREEWITVLPAARRPSAPSQKSQTTFSQQAVAAIGQDASTWSDTPAQKLLRLQQASAGLATIVASVEQERAAAKATSVDKYNQAHRPKTLVEQHKEQQHKEKKKKKQKIAAGQTDHKQEDDDWVGNHPWRPFDRDKDLQTSSKPTNQAEFVKQMGNLSSRFGGTNTAPRKFL